MLSSTICRIAPSKGNQMSCHAATRRASASRVRTIGDEWRFMVPNPQF